MGVSKLFKQFSKMTDEEKADFMELISNDEDEVEKDKEVKQVVETQAQNENNKTNAVETQPKEDKKDSEVVDKTDETIVETQQQPQPTFSDGGQAEGININEVALKQDVDAKIDALNAKLESILKENQDLKDKLSEAEGKAKNLHEKYEKDDFGNQADKNYGEKDFGQSYESADEYLKKFM